jgi:hypothetical protein
MHWVVACFAQRMWHHKGPIGKYNVVSLHEPKPKGAKRVDNSSYLVGRSMGGHPQWNTFLAH